MKYKTIMKQKKLLFIIGALCIIVLLGGLYFIQIDESVQNVLQNSRKGNGNNMKATHATAFPVTTGSLTNLTPQAEQALKDALEDEYKAEATYQAIMLKFGNIRPFSNIVNAESQHIASLKSLFEKYGISIPENQTKNVVVPETIKLSCQAGVDAEIANAALYREKLLPAVKEYPDITAVFTNLMNASQNNHLNAFEKCN